MAEDSGSGNLVIQLNDIHRLVKEIKEETKEKS